MKCFARESRSSSRELQPQVRRHILPVITADINPLNFSGLKTRRGRNERMDDKHVLRELCQLSLLPHPLPLSHP